MARMWRPAVSVAVRALARLHHLRRRHKLIAQVTPEANLLAGLAATSGRTRTPN
jgi:hypothetical protein